MGIVVLRSPAADTDDGVVRSPGSKRDVLRIDAPLEGCWLLALGRTQADLLADVATGCGPTIVDLEQRDQVYALISKRPPDATWDLGARLEVDGELVRQISPAPHWAVTVRHGDDVPRKEVLVRVDAPQGGCWSATIDDGVKEGCGSLEFPLDVDGNVHIFMERRGTGAWPISLAIEVDGQVVQTVGPTTPEYPTFSIGYVVPDSG